METTFEFEVVHLEQQNLLITVQGESVLLFENNVKAEPEENDEVPLPDLVQLFVQLVNLGMLSGSSYPPWRAQAELIHIEVDLLNQQQTWQVHLQCIDPGAVKVLANLLLAQAFSKIIIKTQGLPDEHAHPPMKLAIHKLKLPAYFQPLPFQLEQEEPERPSRNRLIQIVFTQELEANFVETLYQDLELWTQAVILGAYPRPEQSPSASGGFPEGVYQVDAFSVEQSFLEVFAADEAAFYAVINYAWKLHQTRFPVQAVCIQ